MKLDVDLSLLLEAVKKMGAKEIDFDIESVAPPLNPIDKALSTEGFEISLDKVQFINGLASYEGRQILLYIKDHGSFINHAIEHQPDGCKKFHVADCSVLKSMREANRYDRYVVTNNLSGLFTISGVDRYTGQPISAKAKLAVCKCCLSYLNYKGYRQQQQDNRKAIFNTFKLEDFFETYSSFFPYKPSGIADTPFSGYTPDWPSISREYRKSKGYRCEICGVVLSSNKGLLHVHHKNGVKTDNSPRNLMALCSDCHKKQPHHHQLYVSCSDIETINTLRVKQNCVSTSSWKDVYRYSDVALHGLIGLLESEKVPLPVVCHKPALDDLLSDTAVDSAWPIIDLAWPRKKIGVFLNPTCAHNAEKMGWKAFNIMDALSNINRMVRLLK